MSTQKKTGRGRPSYPPGEALSARIQVRVRPDEAAAAKRVSGGDVSAWVRGLILSALGARAGARRKT